MEQFNEQLALRIDRYIESLFISQDPFLRASLNAAASAGLPPINVSPNQGKLLYLIAKMVGAKRILEIGTLGGYSTVWLGRALPGDGKLITLEINPVHAEVAQWNIDRSDFSALVEIRLGQAADSLRDLLGQNEQPFDLIFIDADKPSYVTYLKLAMGLTRAGTVILADNVIRNGHVLDDLPLDENACAAREYNLEVSRHPQLESIVLPIFRDKLDGLAISIVR